MSPARSKKTSSRKPTRGRAGPKKKAAPEKEKKAPPAPNPAALALARQIAAICQDKKALDVSILDVRGMTSYADYLVLASGESDRQVTAIAEGIDEKLKAQGVRPLGSEGRETGTWVLLDYGEVVVHLFLTEVRASYDLDGLWADAPREKVA
ncbi:MAG TPA: ribosome silencing factor [Myxococcaceae bacterium]|nr:ribosome silencing factor [Myxococcaceae bacterium]